MCDPISAPHEAFIKNLLLAEFKVSLENSTVKKHNVGMNNHVYMVTLSQPINSINGIDKDTKKPKPFTHPIPNGTSRLVFRIPRAESNLEDSIRIRNEVSLLTLARDALADVDPSLVPRVFGWHEAAEAAAIQQEDDAAPSYIMEEFKNGEVLTGDDIKAFDTETRASFFGQLARVIKAFQSITLPAGISGHGGVTFDDATGTMTSTKCVIRMGGPFASYREFLRATIAWQLAQSDSVFWLKGWRDEEDVSAEDGTKQLRERIDEFIAGGLDELLARVPEHKLSIIHGDFMPPNLHYDKAASSLTGILDFDFGHVSSPLSEPMFSFVHFHGFLGGLTEPGKDRGLVLSGFPKSAEKRRDDDEEEDDNTAIGRAWEAALAAENVIRPSQVENAELVSDLWWFGQELCQPYWQIPRLLAEGGFVKGREEELRDEGAKNLDLYLTHWGY